MKTLLLAALAMTLSLSAQSADSTPLPPAAKKVPKVMTKFGDKRVDNYFWLREKDNPAVIDYLKAENALLVSIKPAG